MPMNQPLNVISKMYSGHQTFPFDSNRKYFMVYPHAGSALTIEFGDGGGQIDLVAGEKFEPVVPVMNSINIVGSGSYTVFSNIHLADDEVLPQGNRVAVIGTSLVNHCEYATSASCLRGQRGWLTWMMAYDERIDCPIWHDPTVLTGWEPSSVPDTTRYFQGLNFGVSGQTAQQIYDRRFDIAQMHADIYIVDMGTNDIASQTAEHIHNLRLEMIKFLESLNPRHIFILPILARGQAQWDASSAEYAKRLEVNRLSREEIESRPKVTGLDWNAPWVDQNIQEEYPRLGASYDDVHFDGKGARWCGEYMAKRVAFALTDQLPEQPRENLLPGDLTGTAGNTVSPVTGDTATDFELRVYSGDAVVVGSKDGDDNQVITITPQGTSGTSEIRFETEVAKTPHAKPDTWMQCGLSIKAVSPGCITSLLQYFKPYAGSTGGIEYGNGRQGAATNFTADDFDIKIRSSYAKVESDSDSYVWRISIYVDNTSTIPATITLSDAWISEMENPITKYGEIVQQ